MASLLHLHGVRASFVKIPYPTNICTAGPRALWFNVPVLCLRRLKLLPPRRAPCCRSGSTASASSRKVPRSRPGSSVHVRTQECHVSTLRDWHLFQNYGALYTCLVAGCGRCKAAEALRAGGRAAGGLRCSRGASGDQAMPALCS